MTVDDQCNYPKHKMFLKPKRFTRGVVHAAVVITKPISPSSKYFYSPRSSRRTRRSENLFCKTMNFQDLIFFLRALRVLRGEISCGRITALLMLRSFAYYSSTAVFRFIVFTRRRNKIRIISARDMHRKERRVYNEKAKKDSEIQKP